MEKGTPKALPQSTRTRSSSLSEGAGASTRTRSLTTTSASLQEEASKMAQVASTAADKAATYQRKMTDYVGRQAPPGGAGELPSGPCDPAAQASGSGSGTSSGPNKSVTEEAVNRLLQQARQDGDASAVLKAVEVLQKAVDSTPSTQDKPEEAEEEGWQVWTNRRNRRIGADLGEQVQRPVRERTPFQLPGRPSSSSSRGYYTSAGRRHIANADSSGSSRLAPVARLTDQQWQWFKDKNCLGCGAKHQVKNCPKITGAESKALLRAAFGCPEDMRPGNRPMQGRRVPPPPTDPARRISCG